MPTAVERLTSYITRMVSLYVVEGAATQQLFASLDTQIDTAVGALATATTPRAMAAAENQYGHIFKTFGSDGRHFDGEFVRIACVFNLVDDALGGSSSATTGSQADFRAFDSQLFATGHDLGGFGASMNKMGSLRSPKGIAGAVGAAANATGALQSDFAALSTQAGALYNDMISGAAGPGEGDVAAALKPLVSEFASLSADFGNFNTLLGGHSASGAASGAANPLTFDGVFASLDVDFIALDKSLQAMAAPIANLLVHPSSSTAV